MDVSTLLDEQHIPALASSNNAFENFWFYSCYSCYSCFSFVSARPLPLSLSLCFSLPLWTYARLCLFSSPSPVALRNIYCSSVVQKRPFLICFQLSFILITFVFFKGCMLRIQREDSCLTSSFVYVVAIPWKNARRERSTRTPPHTNSLVCAVFAFISRVFHFTCFPPKASQGLFAWMSRRRECKVWSTHHNISNFIVSCMMLLWGVNSLLVDVNDLL